jgi:hypothetical protein
VTLDVGFFQAYDCKPPGSRLDGRLTFAIPNKVSGVRRILTAY